MTKTTSEATKNSCVKVLLKKGELVKTEPPPKISDCAFAANVHFIIPSDRGFQTLKDLEFPEFNVRPPAESVDFLASVD